MISTLLWVSLAAYLAVGLSLLVRIGQIRRHKLVVEMPERSVREALDRKVDSFAFHLVVMARDFFHHGYLYLLVAGHKLALVAKYIAHRMEKRFGRVINSVKGKQELAKKGDASHYLREIKKHQDKIRSSLV